MNVGSLLLSAVLLAAHPVVPPVGAASVGREDAEGKTQPGSTPPQPVSIAGAVSRIYSSMNDVELRLHVFSPARHDSTSRQPAIVFFFGGAWTGGSIEQFVPQAKHFASRGLVAIVADYRVFNRHRTSAFEAMSDARSAIRWVRSHAAELGVDPNRIVASGGSAGGHLALSAAVFGEPDETGAERRVSARPDALVLFNPVVDATVLPARFNDRAQDGSPFHHLCRDLPPTIIVHGKADTTVPYADVERFCDKARGLGNRCDLLGYEGATHGFFNPPRDDGKWYGLTLAEADRFLVSLGYLPSEGPSRGQAIQPVPHIPGVFGADSALERVRDGFVFTEGPVGTADGGLYFTDTGVQPTRIYRLDPDGQIRVFRDTLNRANGLALEPTGALIAAESNGGRVIRVGLDGTVVPLVTQSIAGRMLVNPNDLIADRRGGIYFTDFVRRQRGAPAYVYYLPPGAAEARVISTELQWPNGLSLTEDEKTLIVDDSLSSTVHAFELDSDGLAVRHRTFATLQDIPAGRGSGADGLTIDRAGRVYVTTAVGVQIFDGAGQHLGTLTVPDPPANVAFAGPDKRTLYITARTGLYRIRTLTQGLARLGK